MPKNVEIIFAGPNNGEYFDLISKISMKSYELPLNKIRISNIIQLYKIIVREKIDIAHSNGKGAGFQTRILSLLFQNTQFVHVHHGIHFIGRSVKNMVSILLEKCFSRLTTQVFVSNSELKKGLKHKISGINYAVINNCIHKINDQKGALSENDLPSDYILCVSRFDPIKNIELLVYAFSKICIKFSNLKLLIIGDAVNKYEVEYYKKIMDQE